MTSKTSKALLKYFLLESFEHRKRLKIPITLLLVSRVLPDTFAFDSIKCLQQNEKSEQIPKSSHFRPLQSLQIEVFKLMSSISCP